MEEPFFSLSRGPKAEAEFPGAWDISQRKYWLDFRRVLRSFIHSFIQVRSFRSHRGCREGEKSDMIIFQIIGGELTLRKGQTPNFTVGKLRPRVGRDLTSVIQWPCDCFSQPKL